MAKPKIFKGYSDDPEVAALFWRLLPGLIREFSPNGDIYPRLPNLIAALMPSDESYAKAADWTAAQEQAKAAAANAKPSGARGKRYVRAGRHTWVRDRG